jgi:hypothetical protein
MHSDDPQDSPLPPLTIRCRRCGRGLAAPLVCADEDGLPPPHQHVVLSMDYVWSHALEVWQRPTRERRGKRRARAPWVAPDQVQVGWILTALPGTVRCLELACKARNVLTADNTGCVARPEIPVNDWRVGGRGRRPLGKSRRRCPC